MDRLRVFKGKRVLVTGDTGFKGSWLCIWLKKLGAVVYGFALPAERKFDNFNICNLSKEITHIDGDIRTTDLCSLLEEIQPEIIFHLAAQPIVTRSYLEPFVTFDTNIMGTVSLLDASRTVNSVKSIVVVTSDKCYKNTGKLLSEQSNLGGTDPYSASKSCQDIVATSYYTSFFKDKNIGLSTVRAGNVLGGGDRGDNRIIPDCIDAFENSKDIELRNPNSTRPWQYVLEPLYGYIKLAGFMYNKPMQYSSSWNFGPSSDENLSVEDLVSRLMIEVKQLMPGSKTKINVSDKHNEMRENSLLAINSMKAKNLLGVRNVLNIDDICRFVVEDYFCSKEFLEQRMNRIEQYEEIISHEV